MHRERRVVVVFMADQRLRKIAREPHLDISADDTASAPQVEALGSDPLRLGEVERGALVMLGIVLDRSTPESFAAFEAAIRALPAVLDCHLVAGDFDYFLKLRVRDMADFNRLHGERLIGLPGETSPRCASR